MKHLSILLLCTLLFTGITVNAQSKPAGCPRNLDGNSFIKLKNTIQKHKGDTVAFDAEVVAIEKGFNDKPYFKVKFDNGQTVWVSSMIVGNYVTPLRKLRLLGYIDEVASDDEIGRQFNPDGIQVLAFAILDLESKNLQMADAFNQEAKEWLSGRIPKKL